MNLHVNSIQLIRFSSTSIHIMQYGCDCTLDLTLVRQANVMDMSLVLLRYNPLIHSCVTKCPCYRGILVLLNTAFEMIKQILKLMRYFVLQKL